MKGARLPAALAAAYLFALATPATAVAGESDPGTRITLTVSLFQARASREATTAVLEQASISTSPATGPVLLAPQGASGTPVHEQIAESLWAADLQHITTETAAISGRRGVLVEVLAPRRRFEGAAHAQVTIAGKIQTTVRYRTSILTPNGVQPGELNEIMADLHHGEALAVPLEGGYILTVVSLFKTSLQQDHPTGAF